MENQPKTTNTQVGQNNSQKTPVVLICVLGNAKNTKSGQKIFQQLGDRICFEYFCDRYSENFRIFCKGFSQMLFAI